MKWRAGLASAHRRTALAITVSVQKVDQREQARRCRGRTERQSERLRHLSMAKLNYCLIRAGEALVDAGGSKKAQQPVRPRPD